jgi:hypothetical protein
MCSGKAVVSKWCALNTGSLCGDTDCFSFELVAKICWACASWYSRYPDVTRMTYSSWRTTFLVSTNKSAYRTLQLYVSLSIYKYKWIYVCVYVPA